jgi:hypothetical protein
LRNYPKALEDWKSALQTTPKSAIPVKYLILSTYTGDFQTLNNRLGYFNPIPPLNKYILAYAQLGRGQVPEAVWELPEV